MPRAGAADLLERLIASFCELSDVEVEIAASGDLVDIRCRRI